VKTAVKGALEPHATRGLPRLTLAYNTPTFENSSISGIHAILGESAVVFGIGVLGPEGFDPSSPSNKPAVFALRGGEPFDAKTQLGCGLVCAFLWPSVFIAGAFSPGGQCSAEQRGGTVTKTGSSSASGLKMLPAGALDNVAGTRPEPEDAVIEEIDGRPACEVFMEWMSDEDCTAMRGFMATGLAPGDIPKMMEVCLKHPLGVLIGHDEAQKPVYKTIVTMGLSPSGGISLFGGLSIEVGDVLELMSPGEPMAARTYTADTASRVLEGAGFDFDSVQGCLTVGCGLFWMLGGFDEGCRDLAEKIAGAVAFAPSMGVLGGPELGPMGAKAGYAVYTVGVVVFSSKPAKAQTLMLTDENQVGINRCRSSSSLFVG